MRKVVRVRLGVTPELAATLERTLALCNEGASFAAAAAYERKFSQAFAIQRLVYDDLKAMGLGAQPAIRAIKKASDGIRTLKANIKNGNLGRAGSARQIKALSKPIQFRPDAAQPFDLHCLSWNHTKRTVSIWTVDGRMKDVPFAGSEQQLALLAQYQKGQSDLQTHQGKWYLIATLDIPDIDITTPDGFIGVDMGIVNIATTSTGRNWSGKRINSVRRKTIRQRAKLQKKGTTSAKRVLKRISGREARFVTDTNHVISKRIVTEAKRTGKGIAVEDLTGIRSRVRLRKPQRVTVHSWAFAQLGSFIRYKADEAGVAFVQVDPAYTSQQCNSCGHIDKKNRVDQATFACRSCGVSLNADMNASLNIADRGVLAWGAVNHPHAA
jgi:putative transposase